ncbi:protoporphyrinogen oxidase HemJ [Rubellimicrobium rubrum]|uniref:Protoporphyrinogen IX oxidase n=1 Tax=Rubellimicrobium rubrum TaxID=2585369 RepID=A0A5C4MQN2_9RHOB|nr:protoporphyrinogen oxidase HemJ [Rubellimicrobium rubrum]TNC48162.1 protoporphyrinogen oxidase HemJ [Rubellimicrobium rubrum]
MLDWLPALYLWIKAAHVVAMVAWMAGLFYLPRLFVYHAERATPGSELDQTFRVMEDKLLRLIMRPAMIATWTLGLVLVASGGWWTSGWLWVKLAGVAALTGFHEWCRARTRDFAAGGNTRTGRTFRIANEVPTLLLLIIVVMVIVKPF